jgi:hypothetical protein
MIPLFNACDVLDTPYNITDILSAAITNNHILKKNNTY